MTFVSASGWVSKLPLVLAWGWAPKLPSVLAWGWEPKLPSVSASGWEPKLTLVAAPGWVWTLPLVAPAASKQDQEAHLRKPRRRRPTLPQEQVLSSPAPNPHRVNLRVPPCRLQRAVEWQRRSSPFRLASAKRRGCTGAWPAGAGVAQGHIDKHENYTKTVLFHTLETPILV